MKKWKIGLFIQKEHILQQKKSPTLRQSSKNTILKTISNLLYDLLSYANLLFYWIWVYPTIRYFVGFGFYPTNFFFIRFEFYPTNCYFVRFGFYPINCYFVGFEFFPPTVTLLGLDFIPPIFYFIWILFHKLLFCWI